MTSLKGLPTGRLLGAFSPNATLCNPHATQLSGTGPILADIPPGPRRAKALVNGTNRHVADSIRQGKDRAHNPEVVGSNPTPATRKGPGHGAFLVAGDVFKGGEAREHRRAPHP